MVATDATESGHRLSQGAPGLGWEHNLRCRLSAALSALLHGRQRRRVIRLLCGPGNLHGAGFGASAVLIRRR
jgi:hypothetical protein